MDKKIADLYKKINSLKNKKITISYIYKPVCTKNSGISLKIV